MTIEYIKNELRDLLYAFLFGSKLRAIVLAIMLWALLWRLLA